MHEMLAGISRAGATTPQRVSDELPVLQSANHVRHQLEDKNIRRAFKSAREVRMALEDQPKNESLVKSPVADRSQL